MQAEATESLNLQAFTLEAPAGEPVPKKEARGSGFSAVGFKGSGLSLGGGLPCSCMLGGFARKILFPCALERTY